MEKVIRVFFDMSNKNNIKLLLQNLLQTLITIKNEILYTHTLYTIIYIYILLKIK